MSRIHLLPAGAALVAIAVLIVGTLVDQPDPAPLLAAEPEQMIVVSQGHPHDPCVVEIPQSVYPELQEIGIENWAAACRAAQAAKP